MIKPIKKPNILKREKAQTMVEFALVFPIVLLITYGIIEFGRMMWIYAAVTGAAREGARYGAASGTVNGTRYYKNCGGIRDAVKRGAILIPITDGDISIWYDNGPQVGHTTWTTCPPIGGNKLDPIVLGDRIVVQVDVTYQPLMGSFLGVNGFPITSQNARTILLNVEMGP
jgi:hypothetical protein